MVPHIEIVTVLTIILFVYPIFIYATKCKSLKHLTFWKITSVFNKAIVLQVANVVILGIVAFILDRTVCTNGHGNRVTDIVVGTAMTYTIVGGFFYLPDC